MERRLRNRVILFPAPMPSHLNFMLQLAHVLLSKGFSITIIHTRFYSPNPSTHPHFKFHPINDGLSAEEEATALKFDRNGVIALVMRLNQSCAEPFREKLAELLADKDEEPVACLITGVCWPFTQAVADAHKLPKIILRADSQLALPVLDRTPITVTDLPIITSENKEVFTNFIIDMIKERKAAYGMIWNSFEELEESELATTERDFPSNLTFLIGPIHKYLPPSFSSTATDQACISWLDSQSQNSVVYVSFGSMTTLDESEFVEVAWGLANSKQPFLWVVRPGSVRDSEWLEKLPEGFLDVVGQRGHMIIKWAPQTEVLAHAVTGCFWTHNGWNSTVEGISEGVPMICSPSFGDQFVNAEYVRDYWKVGVQLENGLERGEIEKAIKRIMVEKEGEEMRRRIMCLKEKADGCVSEGGSSFRSLERLVNHIKSFK